MQRQYLAGEPLAVIAERSGMTIPTLVYRLARAGVPRRTVLRRQAALAELSALAAAGMTRCELAERFEVTRETIREWARIAGVTIPRQKKPRAPIDPSIARRYLEGESLAALAEELAIKKRTLSKRLHAGGVPSRYPLPRPVCPACGKRVSSRKTRLCRDCSRRYPPPKPRVCELEGCGRIFVPQASKVARGAGRFCSYAHWNLWRTGRPQSEWAASLPRGRLRR
jgi:hypothetical protein